MLPKVRGRNFSQELTVLENTGIYGEIASEIAIFGAEIGRKSADLQMALGHMVRPPTHDFRVTKPDLFSRKITETVGMFSPENR